MPFSAIDILTGQLKEAHQGFLGTLEGITDDQANFQPTGKALAVAAVWVHAVESEDMFLSSITSQPTIESASTPENLGFSQSQPMENWADTYPKWAAEVRVKTAPLTDYSKQVFAATEKALAGLDPAKLDQVIDMGSMGQPTVEHIISAYIIGHILQITGEISAIKGVQGLKGYPW